MDRQLKVYFNDRPVDHEGMIPESLRRYAQHSMDLSMGIEDQQADLLCHEMVTPRYEIRLLFIHSYEPVSIRIEQNSEKIFLFINTGPGFRLTLHGMHPGILKKTTSTYFTCRSFQ